MNLPQQILWKFQTQNGIGRLLPMDKQQNDFVAQYECTSVKNDNENRLDFAW